MHFFQRIQIASYIKFFKKYRNWLKQQTHNIQLKIVDEVKRVRKQSSITEIYSQKIIPENKVIINVVDILGYFNLRNVWLKILTHERMTC